MSLHLNNNIINVFNQIAYYYPSLPPTLIKDIVKYVYYNDNNQVFQKLNIFLKKNAPKLDHHETKGGNKNMAEKKEVKFDLQMFRPQENFRRRLESLQDRPVTVEVCCGEFLKQFSGCLVLIGCDFIELVGFNGEPVLVNIICCEGTITPELPAFSATIPLDRVAGIESLTPPQGPCPRPPYPGPYTEEDEE